jgi:hypothetical protein
MVCAGGRAGARRSRGGAEEEEGEKNQGLICDSSETQGST